MPRKSNKIGRGPVIHVRLDANTHKDLKIYVAKQGTTIQRFVEETIRCRVSRSASNTGMTDNKGSAR